ncbi:hypothetical protein Tco_1154208 [Tanacetum coccineum]
MDLYFTADENLRELSGEEAWEAIDNFAQGQKEWDNPPNIISEQELASLRAQAKILFGNEKLKDLSNHMCLVHGFGQAFVVLSLFLEHWYQLGLCELYGVLLKSRELVCSDAAEIAVTPNDPSAEIYKNWGVTNIDSSSNSERIDAIISKLDSLGRDMKKLKKNVHAIQVGCQTCGGSHLDKECPLNEEVKSMEEVKYGEFDRPFPNNNRNDGRFNKGISGYGSHDQPSSAFGWLLEEIYVTWAQLEKKRTRPRLYTNYLKEKHTEIYVTWTQFGKKRDKIATLHEEAQKLHTVREDGVVIPCDGVKRFKRRRQTF